MERLKAEVHPDYGKKHEHRSFEAGEKNPHTIGKLLTQSANFVAGEYQKRDTGVNLSLTI